MPAGWMLSAGCFVRSSACAFNVAILIGIPQHLCNNGARKRTFSASIWREDDWYVSQCLEVDVASQGKSEEEALENLKEALELYFEPPNATLPPKIRTIEVEVGAA